MVYRVYVTFNAIIKVLVLQFTVKLSSLLALQITIWSSQGSSLVSVLLGRFRKIAKSDH
jgi:hypothetical protein